VSGRRAFLRGALSAPLAAALDVSPALASQGSGVTPGVLVAYFSRSGNTRVIAGQIRRAHGARLFEIVPTTPYPEDYEATVRQAQQERDSGFQPPLSATVPDFASCRVMFLGFPIWGMSVPPVVRSFLARHDTAGKTVVPFITHGGYGRGDSASVLNALAPRARLLEGFVIEADQERRTLEQVTRWLGSIALK
jgi:flavodoxin